MPWLALDYQQRNIKEHLAEKFQLTTIPTLILIDADSAQIICRDARNQIQNNRTIPTSTLMNHTNDKKKKTSFYIFFSFMPRMNKSE